MMQTVFMICFYDKSHVCPVQSCSARCSKDKSEYVALSISECLQFLIRTTVLRISFKNQACNRLNSIFVLWSVFKNLLAYIKMAYFKIAVGLSF